jgi:hypothetical protein
MACAVRNVDYAYSDHHFHLRFVDFRFKDLWDPDQLMSVKQTPTPKSVSQFFISSSMYRVLFVTFSFFSRLFIT